MYKYYKRTLNYVRTFTKGLKELDKSKGRVVMSLWEFKTK